MHIAKSKKKCKKDQTFNDPLIQSRKLKKFVNLLMNNGKKSGAFQLFLKSLTACKSHCLKTSQFFSNKDQKCSSKIYKQVINQVKPSVEARQIRIGGTVFQVPSITQISRQEGLAMRWIISSAQHKKQANKYLFFKCLGQEFFDSLKRESQSTQKRNQCHILAATNRAYARYRWW